MVLQLDGAHAHPPWRRATEPALIGHGLVVLFGLPIGLLALLVLSPWGVLVTAAVLAQGFPALTRTALVRLGGWRVARAHVWVDWTATARDRHGTALLAVARAHLRRPDDAACAAWLDGELEQLTVAGPGAVVAAGIRAFTRGDPAEARRLWRFAVEFDAAVTPPDTARWAADLLAAEAAAAGDRERMRRELARPRMPRTPFGELLRACDAAERGEPAPLRWVWWALRPSPAMLVLLRRTPEAHAPTRPVAPAIPARLPSVEPSVSALSASAPSTPRDRTPELWVDAVSAIVRLEGDELVRARVAAVADAWDRAFDDPGVSARIRGIAAEVDDPVGALRDRVVTLLADRLEQTVEPGVSGEPGGPLFQEVVWRAADRRDEELGWLADAVGNRTTAGRDLPLIEEIRAFCALVDAYERVVDLAPDRASASFPRLYYPVVRHTVWLHNRRGQGRAANAMYRVELRFAEQCAHDSGVALLSKNLACGP